MEINYQIGDSVLIAPENADEVGSSTEHAYIAQIKDLVEQGM